MSRNGLAWVLSFENRMLKLNSRWASLRIALLLVIVAIVMFTIFTAVTYAGTCSTLAGFPGLLQRAGMVADGPCVTRRGQGCSGDACTTAARKRGKCTNISPRGAANCVCVENTISKTPE